MTALLAALATAAAVLALVPQPAERRLVADVRWPRLPPHLAALPGALPAGRRFAVAVTGGVLPVVLMGAVGLVPGVVVGLALFLVLGRMTSGAGARRRRVLLASLPEACDLLAVAVEAGLAVSAAAGRVSEIIGGTLGDELARVAARVRLGVAETQAWAELGKAPGLERLATEVSRVVSSGVGLAALLRELARDARQAAAAEGQRLARRVGVRSVLPLMVCFLPAFVLLGIVPIFGGIVRVLFA